ncbi:MAG: enoyl-CoA hydratase-related protein [Pseudomonadota bacterium]|nr:enoyl-CoA hydratase-related protein [Pseudomonadota bacterium]
MIQVSSAVGGVTTLTIDRPAVRNAIDLATIDALHAALDAAVDARVIVLTGAGDKVFCAGADLAQVAADPLGRRVAAGSYARLLGRISSFERPVIARLNGHCVAGGVGLLLACDLAVMVDDASLSLPETAVGMWPAMIGAFLLRDLPRKQAMELALTGRKLTAPEAVGLGLVNRAVPRVDLDSAVATYTDAIVARSPSAARIGRNAWRQAADLPLDEALALLADRLGDVMDTEDAAEGFVSFLEKRTPTWKDR